MIAIVSFPNNNWDFGFLFKLKSSANQISFLNSKFPILRFKKRLFSKE